MPLEQDMEQDRLDKSIEAAVANYMSEVVDDIHTMKRAIVGAPDEGNPGILARMSRTERRVAILIWMLPLWVTAGTGVGQYMIALWT